MAVAQLGIVRLLGALIMSRVYSHFLVAALLCISGIACHGGEIITPMFIFELRIPQTQMAETNSRIDLYVADQGANGTFLWACKKRSEGSFQVFQSDFVLGDDPSSKRALIISSDSSPRSALVFILSIPRHPKPHDFTKWQRPDFIADGDAGWAIMYHQKVHIISTNLPPDCFELRYKVEIQDLGKDWDPSMRRKDSK